MESCPVRVMSFNVRGASHEDGRNDWEDRAGLNVETIKRYGPALIGFQEMQAPNLEVYEKDLAGYARIPGPAYGPDWLEEFAAIFYDPGRFEPLNSGGFWLSDTPQRSSASWGNEVVRSANWALLRCRETGVALLHANTHLDHLSERARVEGNRLIVRQTEKTSAGQGDPPVIVTGDFNCKPGSAPYRVFADEDFTDTFLAAGNEDGADAFTFHAFKGTDFKPSDTDKPFGRIDWILVKDLAGNVAIHSHRILRDADEETGLYPSDHYPVLADLELG